MSRATKRKHVLNEAYQDYFTPPTENQEIVRISGSRGNNLHEVESANNGSYLVSMPKKFRKNIWVKRGDYVIVEKIPEGDKVKAEMIRVLSKGHITYFKKIKVWPDFKERSSDSEEYTEYLNNLFGPQALSTNSSESDSETDDN